MKITIENTTHIVDLNGVPARLWEGETDTGIKVHCFVTRIAVDKTDEPANEQFQRELEECRAPSPDIIEVYPLRMVL